MTSVGYDNKNKRWREYEQDDELDGGNVGNHHCELESDEEEEARDENKAGKKENDKEDNDDVYEDMNGFHNLFREGVGGVQQKFKGPSSGDYKDERDEEKMNGNDSNKKGKLDENQEESDSDLDEDS